MLLYKLMLRKNDIVINPNTSRPVRVGSKTWLMLVKQGILQGQYADPKELYTIKDEDDVVAKKEELDKTLNSSKQAVRGRGKYAGKLVSRDKKLNPAEIAKYSSKVAANTIKENIEHLASLNADEIDEELEKLILQDMLKPQQAPKKKVKKEKYVVKESSEEEEEEGDEDESE